MTINIEREKAKRKIIALLNKTVDRGASEGEAMNAAEKAAELMAFYDIECGELEFQEKNIVKAEIPYKSYGRTAYVSMAVMGIAKLCQTRYWVNPWDGKAVFFGFKHDADIAVAMFGYLEETAQREIADYEQSQNYADMIAAGYNRKSIIISFIKGFDKRLYNRLSDMAREREQKVTMSTGTALVPLKHAEIDREMKAQGVKLTSRSVSSGISAGDAYRAGSCAASNVSLSAQMSGNGAARRLA